MGALPCWSTALWSQNMLLFSVLSQAPSRASYVTWPSRLATLVCPSKFQSVQTSGPLHLAVFCAGSSSLSSADGEGVTCSEATLHGPSLGVCGLRFPRWCFGQGGAPCRVLCPGWTSVWGTGQDSGSQKEGPRVCACVPCTRPQGSEPCPSVRTYNIYIHLRGPKTDGGPPVLFTQDTWAGETRLV